MLLPREIGWVSGGGEGALIFAAPAEAHKSRCGRSACSDFLHIEGMPIGIAQAKDIVQVGGDNAAIKGILV
ncbi:MAG: hypothetical protein OXT07_05930 [bacterium]|nr:hypothetical protein [bacterium]MDE0215446.1 hypothetical protein [bacterium]